MHDDILQRLGKLEAAEQIKALKIRYAKGCDASYDAAKLGPLFTEDAIWTDVSGNYGTYNGRQAITEYLANAGKSFTWALHYMTGPIVEVDDDLRHARGSWYLIQPCTLDGNSVWLSATYEDEFEKGDDEVWRISRLEATIEMVAHNDVGWAQQRILGA